MDSGEITGSINGIYDRLNLISGLRLHMFMVAAVGESIIDNWNGASAVINGGDIIAALLLHDIGNIVKFDFDEPKFWNGKSAEEIGYWKGIKRDTIERYGTSSDKEVTLGMASDLGINPRLFFLLSNMGFGNVQSALASNDFELKICMYADQRVGPSGIMGIRERFRDLRERYGRGDNWVDKVGLALENQIFAHARIAPSEISDASVQRYIDGYRAASQRIR